MAKIVTFDTFCYRRELKAMEKEIAEKEKALAIKESQQQQRISDLIGYARESRGDDDHNSDDNG